MAVVGAHERPRPALGQVGLELDDRHDRAVRGLPGHQREARLGGRRRLGHRAARGERHRGSEQDRDGLAAPTAHRGTRQVQCTSRCASGTLQKQHGSHRRPTGRSNRPVDGYRGSAVCANFRGTALMRLTPVAARRRGRWMRSSASTRRRAMFSGQTPSPIGTQVPSKRGLLLSGGCGRPTRPPT